MINKQFGKIHWSAWWAWLAGFCWLCLPGVLSAQDLQVNLSVDHNPVSIDEQFVFQVEVTGSMARLPAVEMPDISAFRVLSGPNESTSFQMINGAISSSKTYQYVLFPIKPGKFTLGPVAVNYKGSTISSNTVEVEVHNQTGGGSAGGNSTLPSETDRQVSGNLFMRAVPSQTTVFVNEQFSVTYKIYFRVPVRNPNFMKLPETVGFWVEEFQLPQNLPIQAEVLNGVQYNVAVVKKLALFPTKAGELTITPMQMSLDVVEQRRPRDPFSAFDNFFDDPFGRTVRKVLTSPQLRINVLPVPKSGQPADFSGLVGSFELRAEVSPSSVPANEAITYKIHLAGDGNLKSIKNFPVHFPAGFEVYEPRVKDEVSPRGEMMYSSRDLEYVLIPRASGQYKFDSFSISYFDDADKRYKTLRTPDFGIAVGAGKDVAAAADGSLLTKSDVALLRKDINFIKEDLPSLRPVGYQPYRAWWFWFALIFPTILVGVAYGYRNHLQRMSSNQEYARKRQAFRQARQRLKGAAALLKQQEYKSFYAEVSRALIGFVADKSNRPAAGLMRDEVERLLKARGVEEELMTRYLKCLDSADFKRFAPGGAEAEEARGYYREAEELLTNLGKYF